MVWIILGIFVGIPALLLGGTWISATVDEINQKKEEDKEAEQKVNNIYNEILQAKYKDKITDTSGSVKELPQLTFDRWLTFYNINPTNWDMEKFATHLDFGNYATTTSYDYLIPTYYKTTVHKGHDGRVREIENTVGIPIFWSSPEEMVKFDHWFKNEYKQGKAAGYERKRDEAMEQLAKYLQEDVNERRAQIMREYEKVVDETQRVKVENSNITLDLNHVIAPEQEANKFFEMWTAAGGNN